MVFLQAAVREAGPAAACLRLVENEVIDLTVGEDGVAELADVLSRPDVRARFPALTDELVDQFLARLRRAAHVVAAAPATFPFDRDPKDAKYLDLALDIGAVFLVTRDNDLLDLMTGDDATGRAWRERAPGVRIVDPVEFLRAVELSRSTASN
jgi:putative PIN family toxin of toxin-antitoxin system